jgi:hypothetical protein
MIAAPGWLCVLEPVVPARLGKMTASTQGMSHDIAGIPAILPKMVYQCTGTIR